MTELVDADVRCAHCGTTTALRVPGSTRSFGSPDLDMRVGGPLRSALRYRVQRCPRCDVCARDLGTLLPGTAEGIDEPGYRELLADTSLPEVSRAFLCSARLEAAAGRFDQAFWSTLSAAWVADDEAAAEASDRCRTMALTALRIARAAGCRVGEQPGLEDPLEADLLRRTGAFAQAALCIRRALQRPHEDVIKQVLRFQLDLVTEKDRTAHTVVEALQGEG